MFFVTAGEGRIVMRIPQIVIGTGLLVLVVLLFTPQRHPLAYNAAAEVSVRGVVEEVRDFYCPVSGDEGTHLMLRTDRGIVEVHVAPRRFLLGERWQFVRGDEVEVVGSKIIFRGHEALIARRIARGTQTVALRKANGKPLWVE
jgi:DNA/RNA endonuclease YhcR with UshA esterase domain